MTDELKPCPDCRHKAQLYEKEHELIAAWNRRVASEDAEAKRITNLLIEEREAHSREVRTLWDQIYWQRAELAAVRRALNAADDSNLTSLAETMMAQRRLLAISVRQAAELGSVQMRATVLANSILDDEPAPAGDELIRMRDALGRVWRLADRGASNAQIIGAAAWGLGVNEKPAGDELPTFRQASEAQLTDDEIDTILAQKPLLTYLAERKAELEWGAEKAAHMDDDKNLHRYRLEIADLDSYIKSTKSLVQAVMERPLPAPDDERREVGDALIAWAADEPLSHDEDNAWCVFCVAPRQFNPKPHAADCLHLRARALRGDDA